MDVKFEGDLEGFTPTAQEICKKALIEKGFTNCVVTVEVLGKKGDNYTANVKRLIVQQEHVNNGNPLKLVVKLAPTIEQVRDLMNSNIFFSNESIVYTELLPKYEDLQDEVDIPKEDRFRYPICYAAHTEVPYETIVLEDITESDFEMLNRFISLNDDQAKMALGELSKFHALSYVLRIKEPEFFNEMKTKLKNMWVIQQDVEQMKMYLDFNENEIQNTLKREKFRKRVKNIMKNMTKTSVSLYNIDMESKYSALIQGDCWTNNMMFKFENNKPNEIILLDYQLTRIASPAVDLLYFVLNCTDYVTRKKYFYEWIDYYYRNFEDFLSNFNIKASFVYPRDKLEADLKINGKNGLAVSFMLANMLIRDSEEVLDIKEDVTLIDIPELFGTGSMRKDTVIKYNDRLEGLIQSCIDFGYI